ncbi:MAG TPA: isocitrate lyase/phosphoenolpyruvate mutase family protein [Pyrinomonadaceae bacterium]|jgi:2-methylisocitrate lyase-like PEP mutase family enzyme|nr:isocitrate lyase/phosphoenolpyruvate mutase family protein [Pyrinomonadaceae bacterium]
MNQKERAELLQKLHVKGDPLILFNIWDAGGAKALEEAGAKAIATGSWSVAAANGFSDGQDLPLDLAIANAKRITAAVDLPVTIDFEGGYAEDTLSLKENIAAVIAAGAVGINFEDQIVGGEGLYSIEQQSSRIRAVREAADAAGIPLFINARTDTFLKILPAPDTEELVEQAAARAKAYAEAGASGFFAPGMRDPELIRKMCELSPLPVNIMVMGDTPSSKKMAELGVARISYGPGPYRMAMECLSSEAKKAFDYQ